MTKLQKWLVGLLFTASVIATMFYPHELPANPLLQPTISPIGRIAIEIDTELSIRHMYRNVTRHQMMEGNNCIESERKECEVYR